VFAVAEAEANLLRLRIGIAAGGMLRTANNSPDSAAGHFTTGRSRCPETPEALCCPTDKAGGFSAEAGRRFLRAAEAARTASGAWLVGCGAAQRRKPLVRHGWCGKAHYGRVLQGRSRNVGAP
jgi:hypothetical protein